MSYLDAYSEMKDKEEKELKNQLKMEKELKDKWKEKKKKEAINDGSFIEKQNNGTGEWL